MPCSDLEYVSNALDSLSNVIADKVRRALGLSTSVVKPRSVSRGNPGRVRRKQVYYSDGSPVLITGGTAVIINNYH